MSHEPKRLPEPETDPLITVVTIVGVAIWAATAMLLRPYAADEKLFDTIAIVSFFAGFATIVDWRLRSSQRGADRQVAEIALWLSETYGLIVAPLDVRFLIQGHTRSVNRGEGRVKIRFEPGTLDTVTVVEVLTADIPLAPLDSPTVTGRG